MMGDKKILARNPSEVPDLATEKEAREFWDTYEIIEEYLENAAVGAEKAVSPIRPKRNGSVQ